MDDYGKFKVYIQELEQEGEQKVKTNKIKRGGLKTHSLAIDLSNPIITWSPDGKTVAVLYEKRYKNYVTTYNTETKEKETKELTRFQKILDANFAKTNNRLVLSVMNNGQSDLYMYYLQNDRVEQLTNDYFDDLNPIYAQLSNGYEGVIFASNRSFDSLYNTRVIDSILPVGNMDIYFYDYPHKSRNLLKITNTRTISEQSPVQIEQKHFGYLSDQNGIMNRFAGYLDSLYDHTDTILFFQDSVVINPVWDYNNLNELPGIDSLNYVDVYRDTAYTFPVTNFATNILEHDASWKTQKIVDVFQSGKSTKFYLTRTPDNLGDLNTKTLNNTTFRNFIDLKKENDISVKTGELNDSLIVEQNDSAIIADTLEKVINEGMYFQSEFSEPAPDELISSPVTLAQASGADQDNLNSGSKFRSSRILPYRIKFSSEYVMSQLDNSLFINKYESFNASGGVFTNPDLSALFTVSISDLFEDYRFTGGVRFPTTFSGGEYFLTYEDLKRRLDKRLTWYYQNERASYTFQPVWFPVVDAGKKTNIVEGSLKWPFDVIRNVRASLAYRSEKIIFLANDTFSLNLPNYKEDWLMLKLEYTHDNTYPVMMNILNGFRYKIWFEWHKQFEVNTDEGLKVSLNDGFMGVVGFDVRHYTKKLTLDKLIELCSKINLPIILLGGKEDFANGKIIEKSNPEKIMNSCGKYNINQSASIIQQAQKVFTHDTGMMHIAGCFPNLIITLK